MIHLSEILKFVEVPGEAYDLQVIKALRGKISRLTYSTSELSFGWIDIPKGKYRIIGTVTADTIDFDCEPYVERMKNAKRYIDYTNERKYFDDPKQSFRSLLNSKGARWVNPYPKPEPDNYDYEDFCSPVGKYQTDYDKWQAAEQSLIKGKGVVLERIK